MHRNHQLLLCYNDPASHPFITDYEKAYLLDELGRQQQPQQKGMANGNSQRKPTKRTPWRQILTNVPFIALILCQVSYVFRASATIIESVSLKYHCFAVDPQPFIPPWLLKVSRTYKRILYKNTIK